MNAEIRFKDKRLLEALEYIDEKYIDDVFDFLKEPAYSKGEQTKISSFKRWRHYLAAAACLLVLALAMPLFTHLPEIINSFAAGWGEGTEEVTDENGTPYTYPRFVDDLEQLSAEDMLKIDELWFERAYESIYQSTYILYLNSGYSDSEARAWAEKIAIREANALDKHRFFNEWHYADSRYYGKINDCVILVSVGMASVTSTYEIAGHIISFQNYAELFVINDEKIITLQEAYDLGYLTNDNIGLISERNDAYNLYLNSYLKEKQNKKEN